MVAHNAGGHAALHIGSSDARATNFIDGAWLDGNPPIIGPMTHAAWLSSIVFDGARAFEGVTPDLDLHCARAIASANAFGLTPSVTADDIMGLALDGVKRFAPETALYIRPLFYAESGLHVLDPDPNSTKFVLTLFRAPMPDGSGFSACLSTRRRPAPDMAPTDAKAACLYPNGARATLEAHNKGYDNAVLLDPDYNVAEFATSNLFMVKDGVVITPKANGTFLAGVTRRRILGLLEAEGYELETRIVSPAELETADEIFNTGNYGKLQPVTRYNDRDLQPGPVYARARQMYWDFAHSK
jgi:branched-chain amino acid aminotransferase